MANKTDTSSIFRSVAAVVVGLLILAAALTFLQASAGSPATEMAALSQSLPQRSSDALAGTESEFAAFDRDSKRLANLRVSAGPATPGSSSDWRALDAAAAAILSKQDGIVAMNNATASIAASAAEVLALSDELLNRSSSTAIIQELQQRSDRLVRLPGLASSNDVAADAAIVAADVAFLRNVTNALGGDSSNLDVRPLNDEGREVILVPMAGHLVELEAQADIITSAVPQVAGLTDAQAALTAAAANIMDSAFSGSGSESSLPVILRILWIPIGLVGLAILLVIVMMFLNRRSSVFERTAKEQAEQNDRNQQAILRLLDEMGSLADGDLTVEATVTEDITGTIADSFNFAIEELRKLVTTVNETAIMVDSAAKQTENTAAHMAKAADNQTREINAATESIVSMAASIEEVSGNAERSSDVARHSVDVAHKGGEAVRRTIDGMNTIRETIQDTSKRIKRLGESSQEIGNIVELINDIAEQTNILALNASIQASMAGEAGRGFAVVADEVQRLAERSTNATKQIEVLVSTIQADTKEAVVSMERSTTDVVGGALLAENAGAALDEIEQVSNQIASLVQNISSSARQQAGSAADVTRRTARLSEISEQTGRATTATAAAISKLSEFASQLRNTVAGFTLPQSAMPATTLQSTSADATRAKDQRQATAG
jgi:twitching motility protein PilJ